MQTLLVVLGIVALGLVAVVLLQRDLSRHPRSGSGGGGPFGAIDEVFAPTRHEAANELKDQYDRTAPAPVAGEPPWLEVDLEDGRSGSVTIRPERRPVRVEGS
jgi:hypothetical protein